MKEIKAFIHRGVIADVVCALKEAGFDQLSVIDVKGTLQALTDNEREYSVELGQQVITETKLEVFCEEDRLENALKIIRNSAMTAQNVSGNLYVSDTVSIPFDMYRS